MTYIAVIQLSMLSLALVLYLIVEYISPPLSPDCCF